MKQKQLLIKLKCKGNCTLFWGILFESYLFLQDKFYTTSSLNSGTRIFKTKLETRTLEFLVLSINWQKVKNLFSFLFLQQYCSVYVTLLYSSHLLAYVYQVWEDFNFSFDKVKMWLNFLFFLIKKKMVKEGICLLSFIKYINISFKINNAFLIQQWLSIVVECF